MAKLIIGTAQLGLDYGRTNTKGKPSADSAREMIKYATDHGVRTFDTARGYGDAEQLLSYARECSRDVVVVTKLGKLDHEGLSGTEIENGVRESVRLSCESLGVPVLQVLLLHSYEAYKNGDVWNTLLKLRKEGTISKLGVSVYDVAEGIDVLGDSDVQHMQLPVNIIDRQWNSVGFNDLIAGREDVVIHARSIFLQGILLGDCEFWPEECDAGLHVERLEELMVRFGFSSKAELCLSYVKSLSWVDGIVIGAETMEQLRENIGSFKRVQLLESDAIREVEKAFIGVPKSVTDPRLWT